MPHVKYFWDEMEDNVVEEYDGDTGSTIASYTTEPTKYGSVLSQDRGGEKRCFQFDGQGNTTELTVESGNVTDTKRYSAFGHVKESTGMTAPAYAWNGRSGYLQDALERCSVRRRIYYFSSGSWYSRDPLGHMDGASLYFYSRNSPVMMCDPSGLLPVIDDIIAEANRRRGHGRWDDSAQHCWAACYLGVLYGAGIAAALVADIGELLSPSSDAVRDVLAQHIGGGLGDSMHASLRPWRCPERAAARACDVACLTLP